MLKSQLRPKSPLLCRSLVGADGALPRSRLEDHVTDFMFCFASASTCWFPGCKVVDESFCCCCSSHGWRDVPAGSTASIRAWGHPCKPWSSSPSSLQDAGLMRGGEVGSCHFVPLRRERHCFSSSVGTQFAGEGAAHPKVGPAAPTRLLEVPGEPGAGGGRLRTSRSTLRRRGEPGAGAGCRQGPHCSPCMGDVARRGRREKKKSP